MGKEPVEVEATGLGAEMTTHFFPLSAGFVFFPFPNIFFPCLRDDFNGEEFVLVSVFATLMSGCDVTGELVVVVTVCKSLYRLSLHLTIRRFICIILTIMLKMSHFTTFEASI